MKFMSEWTKNIYISVDDPAELAPSLQSLHEQGFRFNGPEALAVWFAAQGLPFTSLPVPDFIIQLSEAPFGSWVVVLNTSHPERQPLHAALMAYLLSDDHSQHLLLTRPVQYALLQPELLLDPEQRLMMARQLRQDVRPHQLLMLQQPTGNPDFCESLYSINPAWAESVELLSEASAQSLSAMQRQDILRGTEAWIQIARTAGVHPVQVLLMHHGVPVQVTCHPDSLTEALHNALFQHPTLTPGATLITSHPIETGHLELIRQTGVAVVVSPRWNGDVLSQLGSTIIPVRFNLERLQITAGQLSSISSATVQYAFRGVDDRHLTWKTTQKPDESQLVDLELAVILVEGQSGASVVLVRQQQTLAVATGMPHPMEALEFALNRASGETAEAVCVIVGATFPDAMCNALSQAGISNVVLLTDVADPLAQVNAPEKLPFALGVYAETGIGQVLQSVGVRHG